MLRKIRKLGIGGQLYSWIESFLTNRTQTVVVEGACSAPVPVISGVPQGSVLGPLIFVILMDDIDNGLVYSMLKSFADDTRVMKGVSNVKEASQLQEDLNSVYDWATINNMEFNSLKFEALRYGADDALKIFTNYLSSSGSIIDQKHSVRDLGVMMNDDGTFTDHINHIVDKANATTSSILRSFKSRDPVLMITLWKTLVLPQIEYCSQLWCPTKKGDISRIEILQRNYTRKIHCCHGLNYWERLSKLNIFSLQRRFERYRIIYIWKILEGIVPNVGDERIKHQFSLRNGRTCVIPTIKRDAPTRIQTLRESGLTVHGARLFNSLPRCIRDISGQTIDIFKSKLDRFLRLVPDEPLIPGYTAMRRGESNSLLDLQGIINNISLETVIATTTGDGDNQV